MQARVFDACPFIELPFAAARQRRGRRTLQLHPGVARPRRAGESDRVRWDPLAGGVSFISRDPLTLPSVGIEAGF
jgi:hypothetical protein